MELRAILKDESDALNTLHKLKAVDKGDYEFTDQIKLKDAGYERQRIIRKNNHSTKNIILSVKENGNLVCSRDFDLAVDFEHDFSFSRNGREFEYRSHRIFIENIDYIGPSIEIIGNDPKEILKLFMYGDILQECLPRFISNQISSSGSGR